MDVEHRLKSSLVASQKESIIFIFSRVVSVLYHDVMAVLQEITSAPFPENNKSTQLAHAG